MIKTTSDIENYITPLSKMLNIENPSKWVMLRFMINISLSLEEGFEDIEVEKYDGKDYRLEQITGEGKEDEDYTNLYRDMIEVFDDITISSNKKLEENLQRHIARGYIILKTSLKSDSNIFEFIGQDF
ncbi:DndE family protein [Poseidonibacter lekithochrous]|uniref:DndE family protein n=1 Tax=Poseidonibacter lekithochrous TaxID=1904463 RepID=UPI0008FC30A1|nr:DndE family protein [Poseidonibacter lekithochrous]QKJ23983.1 DNA phosphorothioation system protein DndE [Poseidonibacter lekithochrous]